MPVAVPAGALGLRRHLFLRRLIDRNLRGFGQVLSAEPRTLRSQVRRNCAAMNAMSRLSETTRNAAPTQTAMMLPCAKTNMGQGENAQQHSAGQGEITGDAGALAETTRRCGCRQPVEHKNGSDSGDRRTRSDQPPRLDPSGPSRICQRYEERQEVSGSDQRADEESDCSTGSCAADPGATAIGVGWYYRCSVRDGDDHAGDDEGRDEHGDERKRLEEGHGHDARLRCLHTAGHLGDAGSDDDGSEHDDDDVAGNEREVTSGDDGCDAGHDCQGKKDDPDARSR